jgi:hypothetical protein
VLADGPIAGQAAMWAALMRPGIVVHATNCLRSWADAFDDSIPDFAVQPRANLCPSLDVLRSAIPDSTWEFGSK